MSTVTVTDRRLEALQSLARELVQRGHDPECTTGSGPCERCARAYAGRQVLSILDLPEEPSVTGPSWTTRQEWSAVEDAAIAAWTKDGPQTYPLRAEDAVRAAVEALGPAVALRRHGLCNLPWPTRIELAAAYTAAQHVTANTSFRLISTVTAAVEALGPFVAPRHTPTP